MSRHDEHTAPLVRSVLHPTDFSAGSLVAFHHALKAALLAKSTLTLLHVANGEGFKSSDFPGVRETLERWGLLPKGSQRSAVAELGIDVRKIVARAGDPAGSVLAHLERSPADLIVLATSQHRGRAGWLNRSVAEPVARGAGEMTLLIPGRSEGFVSAEDGSVSLKNILIPVAESPRPQPAIEAAARLVKRMGCERGTFTLLHVGGPDTMPAHRCPEARGWDWVEQLQIGEVIETILDTARETAADLIVMSTDGRNGFLDGLRGSHSERVLRQCAAPLLTVPVASLASDYAG